MQPQPFLSFYTPTYRRPAGLAACLASVGQQTLAAEIEQVVIPDHVGIGIAGMYQRVPHYAPAVHGRYVHVLADDDVLAGPTVVAELKAYAEAMLFPAVIICKAQKGGQVWPSRMSGPPLMGQIDLGCVIVRGDVWKHFAGCYGLRYEGDYDHVLALWQAGVAFTFWDRVFMIGAVSHGRPE
jgi:hypothetical protein